MRARTFRPLVDLLDARLLLDGSGIATVAQVAPASAPMPDDGTDLTGTGTWNVGGNPPVNPYDPTNPPIDLTTTPTTLVTTC